MKFQKCFTLTKSLGPRRVNSQVRPVKQFLDSKVKEGWTEQDSNIVESKHGNNNQP